MGFPARGRAAIHSSYTIVACNVHFQTGVSLISSCYFWCGQELDILIRTSKIAELYIECMKHKKQLKINISARMQNIKQY